MISIEEYNAAEAFAVQTAPQLHQDNVWGVVPQTQGHLVRVQELGGLQVLLNRFQCDRFRSYLYELGGFSREDLSYFLQMKERLIRMQRKHYSELNPVVPVETMLSAMTIYRKIKAARPAATSILEIGPGAGLNALFFSGDPLIRNYTQIEATQATYLSQAMVNETCYGSDLSEERYGKLDIWEAANPRTLWPAPMTRVWHIPWWRVDDLYNTSMYYDVITANACLNEISDQMVQRYLALFQAKSHDNTLLILQDLGDWMYRDDKALFQMLANAGWFVSEMLDNWDIEGAIGNCGHGDAVTTWWMTRHLDERTQKPTWRSAEGKCWVNEGCSEFILTDEQTIWKRDDLARISEEGW